MYLGQQQSQGPHKLELSDSHPDHPISPTYGRQEGAAGKVHALQQSQESQAINNLGDLTGHGDDLVWPHFYY